jgi:hypothetical protein
VEKWQNPVEKRSENVDKVVEKLQPEQGCPALSTPAMVLIEHAE